MNVSFAASSYRSILKGLRRTEKFYGNDPRKALRAVFGTAFHFDDVGRIEPRAYFDGTKSMRGTTAQKLSGAFFVIRKLLASTPAQKPILMSFVFPKPGSKTFSIPDISVCKGKAISVDILAVSSNQVTTVLGTFPWYREFCRNNAVTLDTTTRTVTGDVTVVCDTNTHLEYRITIQNSITSPHTIQIISRHWYFLDDGTLQLTENSGSGLLGAYPLLYPGETHTYRYSYPEAFPSGRGVMKGIFLAARLKADDVSSEGFVDLVELEIKPTLLVEVMKTVIILLFVSLVVANHATLPAKWSVSSVAVNLWNNSTQILHLKSCEMYEGVFDNNPNNTVTPTTTNSFHSESDGDGDTTGECSWGIGLTGAVLFVGWRDPVIGTNSFSMTVTPDTNFTVSYDGGTGYHTTVNVAFSPK